MSTFKRGRNNKLETNLTSSFIAGGTQYTHHTDSLVATYRFEEPFAADFSDENTLKVNDITGEESLSATLTKGSFPSASVLLPEETFEAIRTAESTPYLFSKNTMPASRYSDEEKLTTPNDVSGFQIRSLKFDHGHSERVDLPSSYVDALKSIAVTPISVSRQLYDSGATFAFWIKMLGDDVLYTTDTEVPDLDVRNPNEARSILSIDRENFFNVYNPESPQDGDEFKFGKIFSIRVYNNPGSDRHRKLSVIATYNMLGDKKQYEWITESSLTGGVWAHVAVVMPFTYKASSFGIGDPDPSEVFDFTPQIFLDGAITKLTLLPADVKNTAEAEVLEGIDYLTSDHDPNKFVDIYFDVPTGRGKKTSLLRLRDFDGGVSSRFLPPSATLHVEDGFDDATNHLSSFVIRDAQGNETGFLIDLFHTGSIAKRLNDNDEVESPQMVDPDPEHLPRIDILYDPNDSSFNSAINPANGSFIKLTTPGGKTKTYIFATNTVDLNVTQAPGLGVNLEIDATFTSIPPPGTIFKFTTSAGDIETITFVASAAGIHEISTSELANTDDAADQLAEKINTVVGIASYFSAVAVGPVVSIVGDNTISGPTNPALELSHNSDGPVAFGLTTFKPKEFEGHNPWDDSRPKIVPNTSRSFRLIVDEVPEPGDTIQFINKNNVSVTITFVLGAPAGNQIKLIAESTTETVAADIADLINNLDGVLSSFRAPPDASAIDNIVVLTSDTTPATGTDPVVISYTEAITVQIFHSKLSLSALPAPFDSIDFRLMSGGSTLLREIVFVNGAPADDNEISLDFPASPVKTVPSLIQEIKDKINALGDLADKFFAVDDDEDPNSIWLLINPANDPLNESARNAMITSSPSPIEFDINEFASFNFKTNNGYLPTQATTSSIDNSYIVGTNGVTNLNQFALALLHSFKFAVLEGHLLGGSLRQMKAKIGDADIYNSREGTWIGAAFVASTTGIVPVTMTTSNNSGGINFARGRDFFDIVFGGSDSNYTEFGLFEKSCNNSAIFDQENLAYGFDASENVFVDQLLGPSVSTSRNYSGFPFFDKARNYINYNCRHGGDLLAGSNSDTVDSFSVGHPIFIFGNGSSFENTIGDDAVAINEGSAFASNRYIKTTQKFKGDTIVRFSIMPARSDKDYTSSISRRLANEPSSDSSIRVEVSLDGHTWHSTGLRRTEVRAGDKLINLRVDDGSSLSYAKSTVALSDGIGSKITISDFESSDSWWRHFAFYCDASSIFSNYDFQNEESENHIEDYFIRVIQDGYATSFSDNWAIANLTIEGNASHDFEVGSDAVRVEINADDAVETWDNFVASVNVEHGGEIATTNDHEEKKITLIFQSPGGIIQEGKSGATELLREPRSRAESIAGKSSKIAFCLTKQERIRLQNFDSSSSMTNNYIRIGLKDAADLNEARTRITDVIEASRLTYASGKNLTTSRQGERICIYDSSALQATDVIPAALGGITRLNGETSEQLLLEGFENLRFGLETNLYRSTPLNKSEVAARICTALNENSGTFGVYAWHTASLTPSMVFEHLENNSLTNTLGEFDLYIFSGDESDPGLEPESDEGTIIDTPHSFRAGVYRETPPIGSIYFSGADLAFLGTSHQDLQFYFDAPYPIRGFPAEILPLDYEHASKLAGSSPRCLIDDFSTWTRCLLPAEIHAIYSARRGTFDPISGNSSLDPRIQIRDLDNVPGEYPTNSRSTDEDFRGNFKVEFNSDIEFVERQVYATAKIELRRNPIPKSFIRMTDWRNNSATFVFWSYKDAFPGFPALVTSGDLPSPVNIATDEMILVKIDLEDVDNTVQNFVSQINELIPAGEENFGIVARHASKNHIVCTQTGAGSRSGPPEGNTTISCSPSFRLNRNAFISESFRGAFLDSLVEYPNRAALDHPLIERMIDPAHARSTMILNAPTNKNIALKLSTEQESTSPYVEDSQFAAFGVSAHPDTDVSFLDDNDLKPRGDFWNKNLLKTVDSQPASSKHKIEIDIAPVSGTKLFKHGTIGSTTAYFNFESNIWEPIGTILTGSYLSEPILGENLDVYASTQIAIAGTSLTSHSWSELVGEDRQNLFRITDSFGRHVTFSAITTTDLVGPYDKFRRFSSQEMGILAPEGVPSDNTEFMKNIFSGTNAAFLAGDINIKPVSKGEHGVCLYQADPGPEGNTNIYLNADLTLIPGETLVDYLHFIESNKTSPADFSSEPKTSFEFGARKQITTSSPYARQQLYIESGTYNSRNENFRRWLDTLSIGFGPSIGLQVAKSTELDYEVISGSAPAEGKYIFMDGGLSNPTTTFGFPFHPKFHATSSQAYDISSVLSHPFAIEKIVYEFRANMFESASIEAPGDGFGPAAYNTSRINLPTPTFFILNQRKCALSNDIESSINSITISDDERVTSTFSYTASIPSNFYLTSTSLGDPGPATFVDDLRDLVTFARVTLAPEPFVSGVIEAFANDIRADIDLVIVPKNSPEATEEGQLLQEEHPASSFTLTAPVRSPKKNIAHSSYKVEGDFFGSKPTTYKFLFEESPSALDGIKQFSDAFILEDAAGEIRRFIFKNASCAFAEIAGTTHLPDLSLLSVGDFTVTDTLGNSVKFEFNVNTRPDEPTLKNDAATTTYYVGILGIDSSSLSYYDDIIGAISAAVNLANTNNALNVFATPDYVTNTVRLTQDFAGQFDEEIDLSWSEALACANPVFDFGGLPDEEKILYRDFGSFRDILGEPMWVIPVTQSLASPGGLQNYASKFYEALSIAGQEHYSRGGFKIPFVLQETGSTPTAEFTFTQGVSGMLGYKNIAGTQTAEDFKDITFADLSYYADYTKITIEEIGAIQGDVLQLDWAGNRTGIDSLQSGRSPFGGENSTAIANYNSLDSSGACIIQHKFSDSTDAPYLLLPGDKLIFGWQSPIGTGSFTQHGESEEETGSFEILPGAGKIVLYGSFLQDGQEKTHVTSNQPLTSVSVHEAIFSDADVHDSYDTEPAPFHFDSTIDQFVDGIVSVNSSPPTFTRQIVSRASSGNHAVGTKDGSYPIFSKRSSFFRGFRLIDEGEYLFDSMLPSVGELMTRDDARAFSPNYDGNFTNAGVVILAHPSISSSLDPGINAANSWSAWMSSHPFESKYDGLTRALGFNAGVMQTGNADDEKGIKKILNVWLANNSSNIGDYNPEEPPEATQYCDMLYNIEARNLLQVRESTSIATRPQPYNLNFTIVTDESGEGASGETLDKLDFVSLTLGTRVEPRTSGFFSRLFFGSGSGPLKFPKLPYWKNVFVEPGQGFDSNETFPATRGVVIRGFKYGLANVAPTRTSAVFRRDKFGQFRDMLEQRPFTAAFSNGSLSNDLPVTVVFRNRNTAAVVDPAETNSLNISTFCTSSVPYSDGEYRDRLNAGPDDRGFVEISVQIS